MCVQLDSEAFGGFLDNLPRLQCLALAAHGSLFNVTRGMAWGPLKTAMSLPSLREFSLRNHLFCPQAFAEDPTFAPPPLTAFRCTSVDRRPYHHTYPAETEALGFVLDRLRGSLETIELLSDAAPFHTLGAAEWPRLRSLELRGDAPVTAHTPPLHSVLGKMPHLRSLHLKLALPERHGDRVVICPPGDGVASQLSLVFLEELTITYPHPHDQLYPNLPSSLRKLSLECFLPFNSCARHMMHLKRQQTILSASDILTILGHCRTPYLHTLKIEYRVDGAEEALLSYIPVAFRDLKYLRLCRYRAGDDTEPELDRGVGCASVCVNDSL